MKICLFSAFPSSHRGLSECGYHMQREQQQDPLLSQAMIADEIDSLLPDLLPGTQKQRAIQNLSVQLTVPQIIRQYLRSFSLHRKRKAPAPLARFSQLLTWVPSRSISRAAAPRWVPWM